MNSNYLKSIIDNIKDIKTTFIGIILILLAIALIAHAINGAEFLTIITVLSGMGFVFGTGSKDSSS